MTSPLPSFSVIIPTRNRPEQLAACLESLARLDYPRDRFEVIVVDDGGNQPLDPVVARFCDRLNLTLLTQPPTSSSVARNGGAARATGEFLAFTDDDCTLAPDWLQALAARLASAPDHAVGGRTINALPENLFSAASHVILDAIYDYYDPHQGRAHFFPTCNLALPASRFRALGGFSKDWPMAAAEDREFCYRWLQRGWLLARAPEACVYHHRPLTLRTFWRQHFTYGRGAFRYHQVRTDSGPGSRKPDRRFYWTLFRQPFRQMPTARALAVALLLLVSQAATVAGYFSERAALAKRARRCQRGNEHEV
ncbi:MAG: glycosyltransferase [Verrucomicrobia bacterium]|nr:glycosyltransferase [Verrucomicrobiota bacterium]